MSELVALCHRGERGKKNRSLLKKRCLKFGFFFSLSLEGMMRRFLFGVLFLFFWLVASDGAVVTIKSRRPY